MKRLCLVIGLITLFMAGCGNGSREEGNAPKIEDYTWQMASVQSTEAEGAFVAIGPGMESTEEGIPLLELTCTASNGELFLSDSTNGNDYSGTYELLEVEQQTATYKITVEEQEGMAVVSYTTYHDDREEPAFIMSMEGHALNFLSSAE